MLSYLQERNAWLLHYIPKRPWICSSTERKKIEHIIQIVLWAKIKKKKIESTFLYSLPDSRGSSNPYSSESFWTAHRKQQITFSLAILWFHLQLMDSEGRHLFENVLKTSFSACLWFTGHTLVTSPVLGWALILVKSSSCFQGFLWLAKQ